MKVAQASLDSSIDSPQSRAAVSAAVEELKYWPLIPPAHNETCLFPTGFVAFRFHSSMRVSHRGALYCLRVLPPTLEQSIAAYSMN